MYYPHIKEQAIKMREIGTSLNEIAKKLHVNKSTLSFWCKNIILAESAILKIKTQGRVKSVQGLIRYTEIKRKERMDRNIVQKHEGAMIVGKLSPRDVMMIGMGLYWGEGYKYENGEFGFTNSNPYMIRFYFRWLKLWKVDKSSLIFRLTINEIFRKEEKNIKKFWLKFLDIGESQFSKTTYIQTNLKKASFKNMETYKGILRVKVRKGISIRNAILGAIDHISTNA